MSMINVYGEEGKMNYLLLYNTYISSTFQYLPNCKDRSFTEATCGCAEVVRISNNVVQYVHGRGRLKYIHVYTL